MPQGAPGYKARASITSPAEGDALLVSADSGDKLRAIEHTIDHIAVAGLPVAHDLLRWPVEQAAAGQSDECWLSRVAKGRGNSMTVFRPSV